MKLPIEDREYAYLRKEEGRELRDLRIRAGLTQLELAAAAKMTLMSIAMAEGQKALSDAARVTVLAHLAIIAGRTEWQLKGGRSGGAAPAGLTRYTSVGEPPPFANGSPAYWSTGRARRLPGFDSAAPGSMSAAARQYRDAQFMALDGNVLALNLLIARSLSSFIQDAQARDRLLQALSLDVEHTILPKTTTDAEADVIRKDAKEFLTRILDHSLSLSLARQETLPDPLNR